MLEPELFPKPRLKGKELEDAREIYGVTQFMLGNRSKAEIAFRQIIQANPRAKLDKRYLLDPAAEPFFESLKKSSGAPPTAANRKSNPAAAAQQSPRASQTVRAPASNSGRGFKQASGRPTPPPEAPRRKPPPAQNRAPQGVSTGLQVTVNAPRATLFADGIFIGPPNQKISLDPGKHQITISAEGYETQEKTVRIEAGRISQLKVTLIKTGSRQAAAPARNSAAQPQKAGNQSKTAGRKGDNFDSNQPKASLNFNQELPAEKRANRSRKNFTDQYFQEPAAPQYQQPPAQPQYSQPPQYAQPPTYTPPPQYAPPQYIQPQPYQQPYAYPPPVYANPPAYQAPSPYGYQDPYAQPPPAYAAPPTPGYGEPNPYEEEDEAGDSDRPAPRSAGFSKSRKTSRRKGNIVLALLPLGIGQFQNGDSVKGVIFLFGQGGALGFGLTYRLYNIPKDKKLFDTQREEEADLTPEEKETIEIQREEHIKKLTNYSNYALIGAGALYLIGVIDAIVNLDSGAPNKRRRSDYSLSVPDEKKYKFAIGPTPEGGVGIGVSMNLD